MKVKRMIRRKREKRYHWKCNNAFVFIELGLRLRFRIVRGHSEDRGKQRKCHSIIDNRMLES